VVSPTAGEVVKPGVTRRHGGWFVVKCPGVCHGARVVWVGTVDAVVGMGVSSEPLHVFECTQHMRMPRLGFSYFTAVCAELYDYDQK
jgi:hypothetical protein